VNSKFGAVGQQRKSKGKGYPHHSSKRALHSALESGRIMDAFKVAGLFPRDKVKALQNPYVRIVSEDEHSEPLDLVLPGKNGSVYLGP